VTKAIWNGKIIAQSDRTEVVEGNHYFPMDDVQQEFLIASAHQTTCPWKGIAEYYTLFVEWRSKPRRGMVLCRPKARSQEYCQQGRVLEGRHNRGLTADRWTGESPPD
jgi:hypothetical protein